jgi:hypothetical protein
MHLNAPDQARRPSTAALPVSSRAPAPIWTDALLSSRKAREPERNVAYKKAMPQPHLAQARATRPAVPPEKKLTDAEIEKIWNGLPVLEKPGDAETAARELFSAARHHATPHSRAAIMVGESHDIKGMLPIYQALFKSAKPNGYETFLMELDPDAGKVLTGFLPKLEKTISKSGGLGAYMRSLPDEDIWGAIPLLTAREALRHGLKLDFIDHDTADDIETRNKTMVRGIRKHIDAGENVFVFNGALHVPDMQRSLLQKAPGHRTVNPVSAQFFYRFSDSVKRGSIENFRKSPVPPGRAQLVRISDQMKDYISD